MPTLSIITNLPKHKVPSSFLADASHMLSQKLNVHEGHVIVKIKAAQPMHWFMDESLCGIGSLSGTGIYGLEENKKNSAFIFDFIEKELGIPQNRLYISFVDQKPSNVGVQRTTLEEILQ
ncbi:macrophage migration inhibitory factor homolog [Daktulosphaira vitifoliae]|uniref:macrophage migration inhibitory factor homolog n=1 Tax=Daktulosphaira vitifoliae TaxID=58002 RepID=UPI0021A99DC7|nr:macrophage migration inhibitory factor homolog [Daktulosphaira vitifoliae]